MNRKLVCIISTRSEHSPCVQVSSRIALLLIISMAISLPMSAQPATTGELVIHYNDEPAIGLTFPFLAVLNPSSTSRNITNAPPEGDILLTPNGNLYVASAASPNIATYSASFVPNGTITTTAPIRFLAMDRTDNLYASTPTGAVNQYSTGGALIDTFQVALDPGDEVAAGDLGTDQCTLYYFEVGSNPRVRRYDICQRQQLADVGPASTCFNDPPRASLRVASDGAVLLAACVAAYRFTTQGVQTYPMQSLAIAPTAEGQFFWTGASALSLVNAQTGAVTAGPISPPASGPVTAIEIAGAPRASTAAAATEAVPALSTPLLLLLLGALGILGLLAARS